MSDELTNPCGLRGLAFLVVTAPDPAPLHGLLRAFGFSRTRHHAERAIDLYEQGAIRVLVDRSRDGVSARFAAAHGPSISAIGLDVADARAATEAAVARGGHVAPGELAPAIEGIGGSLIYFVDPGDTWTTLGFVPIDRPDRVPEKGFLRIDHLTNNVPRGELGKWSGFYKDVLGFSDVRTFDIHGEQTGLHSYALRSPCGTFCIPINEGSGTGSQIDEYLEEYRGPGIQHVAFLTDDILASLRALDGSPIRFLDIDVDYYDDVFDRVPNVREDHDEIARRAVLVDGDQRGYLLQIFTKNLIGPIFVELIQRRDHHSFGEGNFTALFRSIERDQQKRGYLAPAR